ncbi:MAG TPA: aminotransferase class I/II-fold pyridoxal phosphate-dependent enzyme [Candidatus Dormibacteraeota bacterium]|nr:aminotransferase class I/II-fold pyridoxal phosphate-dependent enzyme [Candidatus Dormibacteraeota bacterium]
MTGSETAAQRARRHQSRTAPVVPPIYQTTIFHLDDISYDDVIETGGLNEDWYSRFRNPTVAAAAEEVARLEGAPAALMTSSGMAAIASTLLTLAGAGDRIVAARELYGDTFDLLTRDLPRLGIEVEFVRGDALAEWEAALSRGPVAVVYAETLSNPQLRLLDISAVAALAHQYGVRFVVDNTFASPAVVRPLELGADLVVQSASKYLNGHSDVIAGCVAGPEDLVQDVQRRVITFGGSLDPHAAFLVLRGLRTFEVRLQRQQETALAVARFLEQQPEVTSVIYPGLESYPHKEVASRLLARGRAGGMVSFVVRGGDRSAGSVMRNFQVLIEATSLGGVETLASTPHNSSHFSLTVEEREAAGIPAGMIRLSIGLEAADSLTGDIRAALDQVFGRAAS